MRKVRGLLGGTVLALSMISVSLLPMAAYGQANPGEPGAGRPRMHRMIGVEAPWVSIALRHQKDLSLSPDQVATLEKIRTQFRDQSTPIQEQLRAIESDLASSLQEKPANIIQDKIKIEQSAKLRTRLL